LLESLKYKTFFPEAPAMRLARVRFTVRRRMVVVAAAGACAVAVGVDPALGALVAGVAGLALVRTFEAVDRYELKGTAPRPASKAGDGPHSGPYEIPAFQLTCLS
jgi:hypothetical protein